MKFLVASRSKKFPSSARITFDGGGEVLVDAASLAYFDDDVPIFPRLGFVAADGAYQINKDCTGEMRLIFSYEEGSRGYQIYSGPLADMQIPIVLYGRGNIAEGFFGTVRTLNLGDGAGTADIGCFEGKRQGLSAAGDGAVATSSQQQATTRLNRLSEILGR